MQDLSQASHAELTQQHPHGRAAEAALQQKQEVETLRAAKAWQFCPPVQCCLVVLVVRVFFFGKF